MRMKLFRPSMEDESDSDLKTTDLIPLAKDDNRISLRQERPERLEAPPKEEDFDEQMDELGESLECFSDMLQLYDRVSSEGYSSFTKEVYSFYKEEINNAIGDEAISFEGYDDNVINASIKNFQISTETIIGAIRTIGMLIYKVVSKVLIFIGSVWKRVFSGAEKVEERANETLAAIQELQKKIQNGEISVSEGTRQIAELSSNATREATQQDPNNPQSYQQDQQAPQDYNQDPNDPQVISGQSLFASGFFPDDTRFIGSLLKTMTSNGYESMFQNIIFAGVTTAGAESGHNKKVGDIYDVSQDLLHATKRLAFFNSNDHGDFLANLNDYFKDLKKYNHSAIEEKYRYDSFNRQKAKMDENRVKGNYEDGHNTMTSDGETHILTPESSLTRAATINVARQTNQPGRKYYNPHTNADIWFCVQLIMFLKIMGLDRITVLPANQVQNAFSLLAPPRNGGMSNRDTVRDDSTVYFLSSYVLGAARLCLTMKGSFFNIIDPIYNNRDKYLNILSGDKLKALRDGNDPTQGDAIDRLIAQNRVAFDPLIKLINEAYDKGDQEGNAFESKVELSLILTHTDLETTGAYEALVSITNMPLADLKKNFLNRFEGHAKGITSLSVISSWLKKESFRGGRWFSKHTVDRLMSKLSMTSPLANKLRQWFNSHVDDATDAFQQSRIDNRTNPNEWGAGTTEEGGSQLALEARLFAMYSAVAEINMNVDIPKTIATINNLHAVAREVKTFNGKINQVRKDLKELADSIKNFSDDLGGKRISSGQTKNVKFGKLRSHDGKTPTNFLPGRNPVTGSNGLTYGGQGVDLGNDDHKNNNMDVTMSEERFNTLGYMLRRLKVLINVLVKLYGSLQVNLIKAILTSSNSLTRAVFAVVTCYNQTFGTNGNRSVQEREDQAQINAANPATLSTYKIDDNAPHGADEVTLHEEAQQYAVNPANP